MHLVTSKCIFGGIMIAAWIGVYWQNFVPMHAESVTLLYHSEVLQRKSVLMV